VCVSRRAYTLVIFDRHAKRPIVSGSVPLTLAQSAKSPTAQTVGTSHLPSFANGQGSAEQTTEWRIVART
jgi:hypothetical protein